jgi:hypothetical protein
MYTVRVHDAILGMISAKFMTINPKAGQPDVFHVLSLLLEGL